MTTLLLDTDAWDVCLDASGNIALADRPYALAQDAASAIRLFAGELWYDTTQGVPYLGQILGQTPSMAFLKTQFIAAALTVPGVVSAQCFITAFSARGLSGQVQVSDAAGTVVVAAFSAVPAAAATLAQFSPAEFDTTEFL